MKTLKNLKSLILILAFAFVAIGCSNSTSKNASIEGSLPELMTKIYSGTERETANLINTEITAENLNYYTGLDSLDFKEGLASEPMINVDPHSVVLLRVNDVSQVEDIKSQIKAKVDPRKWICVEVAPENVIVDNIGDLVIVIMDNNESKALHENFKNLSK